MNLMGFARRCRVCDLDLVEKMRRAIEKPARDGVLRMMNNGMCDPCQVRRQSAAVEFIRAADEVRMLLNFGAASDSREVRQAGYRMHVANRQCVKLLMWPAGHREENL